MLVKSETPTFNSVSTENKILAFCFLQEASALTHSKRDRMYRVILSLEAANYCL